MSCGLGLAMTPFKTSRLLGRTQELHFLDIISLVDPGARDGALQGDMEARGKTPGFCGGSSSREEGRAQKGGSRQNPRELKAHSSTFPDTHSPVLGGGGNRLAQDRQTVTGRQLEECLRRRD